MHAIENNILDLIENKKHTFDSEKKLCSLPLGQLSKEFYENPQVKEYGQKKFHEKMGFRLALEEYIASDRSQKYLENIETAILKLPSPMR